MNLEVDHNQKQPSSTKPQEILLGHQEYRIMQSFLPKGYSFAVANKNTRLQQSRKVVEDEEIAHTQEKTEKVKRNAYAKAEQTIQGTSESFKKCTKVLAVVKRNANAGPFLEPVDPIALGIPTYFDIIKNPMDLRTVEAKLKNGDYDAPEQFENDMRLIWNNALIFNPPGSQVHRMAENLSGYFEELLRREEEGPGAYKSQPSRFKSKGGDMDDEHVPRQSKGPTSKNMMEKPLTYQEKKQLSNMIRLLPTEHLWGVWNIVSGGDGTRNNEELEFDIETLPVRAARELEKYVRSKINSTQKKKKPSGTTQSGPATIDKHPMEFKEDARSSETKPLANTESLSRPMPMSNSGVLDTGARSVQPNFRIDAAANNKLSSESSFISDLEDSD